MLHRLRTAILTLAVIVVLAGCGLNKEKSVPTVIVFVPTNTLVPSDNAIPTVTPTIIPTATTMPTVSPAVTNTAIPVSPPALPTATATASILGTVNNTSSVANLRSGPGQQYPVIQGVRAGTSVIVLGANSDKDWYNVRLVDAGIEGWLATALVNVASPDTITVLSTEDLARRTQQAGTPGAGTDNAVHKPGVKNKNDVLAYCDNKSNGEPRKTLASGTTVVVYWSWYAKTPEQLKDHIDYSQYDIRVDNKPITNWQDYRSDVVRDPDGNYYVYWYVPIGAPGVGDHRIEFHLSWKQPITDGYNKFGPGEPDNDSTVGSCIFTIR